MIISQLIDGLQKIKALEGDLPVLMALPDGFTEEIEAVATMKGTPKERAFAIVCNESVARYLMDNRDDMKMVDKNLFVKKGDVQ